MRLIAFVSLHGRKRKRRSSGIEEEFYGDVVPGGYNSKTKKWHISYFSDAESEDLNIKDVLSSLHDGTAKPTTSRATKIPTSLLHKVFTDDEDENAAYYVSEVKYSADFDQICCFCVPYAGNLERAKELSQEAKSSKRYRDDCIFDCDYVQTRVDVYTVS